MGLRVIATCKCGYCAVADVGYGMLNPLTLCFFPCMCERCKNVVQVNILDVQPECPLCKSKNVTPYNDPKLSDGAGEEMVVLVNIPYMKCSNFVLTDGNYLCPKCQNVMLRFTKSDMVWD